MISRKNIPKKPTRIVNQQNIMRREAADMGLDTFKYLEAVIEAFTDQQELTLTEVRTLLSKCGIKIRDSELESVLPGRATRCDYSRVLAIIKGTLRKEENGELDEIRKLSNDLENAFVALGGNFDRSGSINKLVLTNIIKKQFELTFNIEDFLDSTIEANELDFQTFANIFAQAIEHGSQRSIGSQHSIKSFSGELTPSVKIGEEGSTERIHYSDFEMWLSHNYR